MTYKHQPIQSGALRMKRHKRVQRDIFKPLCNAAPDDPNRIDKEAWFLTWHWAMVTCKACWALKSPLSKRDRMKKDESYVQLLEKLENEIRKTAPKLVMSMELSFLLNRLDTLRNELERDKASRDSR